MKDLFLDSKNENDPAPDEYLSMVALRAAAAIALLPIQQNELMGLW